MGVLKALRFYRSLSPEQKDFVREKKIEDTLTVGQWLRFLTRAAAYDEYGDEGRKKITPVLVVLWLLFVASIVLLFIVENALTIVNIIVILLILALLVFYHWAYAKLKRRDLTNQLRLLFVPFLRLLQQKAGDDAKLAAKLDFSDFLKGNPVNVSKNNGRTIELYQPQYILGRVQLLDLSIMEFVIGDEYRKLTIRKRSASGKTKIKTKYKITHQAFVKLAFPKVNYLLSDRPGAAIIVEKDDYIIVKRRLKVKSDKKDAILKLDDFLVLVDELYKAVKIKPGVKLPVTDRDVAARDAMAGGAGDMDFDEEALGSGAMFMVWGAYFSHGDYIGFEGEQGEYYMADEETES